MKKLLVMLLIICMAVSMAACSNGNNDTTQSPASANGDDPVAENNTSQENGGATTETNGSNILVAYFSRTGEQYGVGVIEKGNTAIVADMIAEETGADTFEILPADDYYPTTYKELTEVAQQEKNENARPAIKDEIINFSDYDTVFIGYPNWWGDMPMIVYTFLESYDFDGKTVIPFCTHAGSGLSGTEGTMKSKLSGATVETGLAVTGATAQNDQSSARTAVESWLSKLGY
ncbi:MAG: flavodoxin [Oscillospiraceae bacterium]|nr:flavodoxin [Oscillospiraceae bacterium]